MSQMLLYFRFRHRLVALNRQIGQQPWSTDLLVARAQTRMVGTRWVALPGPFVVVAAVLLAVLIVVDLARPALLDSVGSQRVEAILGAARPYEWTLLVALLAYLLAEGLNLLVKDRALASISVAMDHAAKDPGRAVILGAVRDRGIHNEPFLQAMFAEYERLRKELEGRFPGLVIRSLDDDERLAGAWVLRTPGRLTDVVVEAGDAEVMTEDGAELVESRLLPYARTAQSRAQFLAQLRRRGRPRDGIDFAHPDNATFDRDVEAGLNYVVRRLRWDTEQRVMRIEVDRARYGQIMRSCDYHIEEAFIAAGLCAKTTARRAREALPLRGAWLMRTLPGRRASLRLGVDELLAAPRHRAAGVGLAGVVMYRRPVDNVAVFHYKRRSDVVGTYPGMYHAVPTGMFNSKTKDTPPDHDQRVHAGRVLLTEFLEECKSATDLEGFDEDEFWDEKLKVHIDWMLRDPEGYNLRQIPEPVPGAGSRARLDNLIAAAAEARNYRRPPGDERCFKVYTTGLAFDLLSLRPEICCVIELDWGVLADITLNEEGTEIYTMPSVLVPSVSHLPPSTNWVRSGYAAIRLACESVDAGLDATAACGPADFGLDPD